MIKERNKAWRRTGNRLQGEAGYRDIAARLRREWTRRPWQAGQPLPRHEELERQFGTTRVTIQRAMNLLIEQGFVEGRRKAGRFLAVRPPHLYRYGLVFQGHPESAIHDYRWTRFSSARLAAMAQVNRATESQLVPYFDVEGTPPSAGLARLQEDVAKHGLAGLVFSYSPHDLLAFPLLQAAAVPMVMPHPLLATAGTVLHQAEQFHERATETLVAAGRRHVAVLTIPAREPQEFAPYFRARNVISLDAWTQSAEPYHVQWVRHALQTMLYSHSRMRPNGLIITDDHLVEPAMDALAELGVRVPDDLLVIGHWNYPLPYNGRMPVRLLGFDACEFLRAGLRLLQGMRDQGRVPPVVPVPARFDDERLTVSATTQAPLQEVNTP